MLRSTLSGALTLGVLGLGACVSDSGTTPKQDADAGVATTDASSPPSDATTTLLDSGTDATPGGPCQLSQPFEQVTPIGGATNATWFTPAPNEQLAFFANGANDDLYAAQLANLAVSAPRALLPKAISAAAGVDAKGQLLLAFEPSGDFEVGLDWDPGPNNGPLVSRLVLKDFTDPAMTADATRLVVRFQGAGINVGDRHLYQFKLVADYDTKKISAEKEDAVLEEHASHPALTPDGLAVVYVYDDIPQLRYATRGKVTDPFVNPQPLAFVGDLLKGARPHGISRDLCRLYFTNPGGGAFVATRKSN